MEENRNTERPLKPHFMKKEIVVAMPKKEEASFGMAIQECRATVLYVGENQPLYKVGDDILFDRTVGREIKFFQENLWKIDSEQSVICKIE